MANRLVDRRLLDHLAGVHHDDALRRLRHHAHRVGDQHDRHAEALFHVLQQLEDLRLDGDIERGGRLVGDQELGIAGQRHRDHDALAHAAGELVRKVVEPLVGVRNLHQPQHLDGLVDGTFAAEAFVPAQHLGDLLADGVDRIERGHRLLEHHRDVLGADTVHLAGVERHEVAALIEDLARDDLARRHRDQLQHRHRRDGLAAAGFADHAERLAAFDRKVDAVDRLHYAVVGREMRSQAPDFEQRRRHHITLRGSSASRSPSPMKLMVSTVRKIAAPGKSAQCGAMSR